MYIHFNFIKNGLIPASICLFSSFNMTNKIRIDKSYDGVLGTRTWGGNSYERYRHKSTELWRHPFIHSFLFLAPKNWVKKLKILILGVKLFTFG